MQAGEGGGVSGVYENAGKRGPGVSPGCHQGVAGGVSGVSLGCLAEDEVVPRVSRMCAWGVDMSQKGN
jgi:hypothetical protein